MYLSPLYTRLPSRAVSDNDMAIHNSNTLTDRVPQQVQSGVTSLSLPVGRVANIDRLRILAAVGIVWFHTAGAPYRWIGYAGLPVFLLIFFSLVAWSGHTGKDRADFLKRRWSRLIVPWLFWSAVYGLCRAAKAVCVADISGLHRLLSVQSLLAGTQLHLWYLPYAFVLGFGTYEISRRTSRTNDAVVVLVATVTGICVLAAHAMGIFPDHLAAPLPQWCFGLAAAPLGLAVGRCLAIPSQESRRWLLLVVFAGTVMGCIVLSSAGSASLAVPYGLAMTLVSIACAWQVRGDAFVASVAPLTFGIYLIHPLIGFGLQHLVAASWHYPVVIVLTVGISGLVTLGLIKTPLRRFV
jgi:surface polysaccharide O-acyltransferase-like enzyme